MRITYSNGKVQSYFGDFNVMQAKIGFVKTKIIKKFYNHLLAARNFSVYLSIGIGKPHPLHGNKKGWYGIWVTGNVRLLLAPQTNDLSPKRLMSCDVVEVKGVSDYHGGKDNWIIP